MFRFGISSYIAATGNVRVLVSGVWGIVPLIAVLKLGRFISLQLLSLVFFCSEMKEENSVSESEFCSPSEGRDSLEFCCWVFLFESVVP